MENLIRIRTSILQAKSLHGNPLEDPEEREIITLECGSADEGPVLLGLAGFFGTSRSFLNRSYTNRDFLDTLNLITRQNPDISFRVVLPDTMTSLGGNQYLNSQATGNYLDFIVKDVVSFIRREYGSSKILIFGKSSGGFGAYNIASLHPDIFSGFIDVAGDSAFEYCYLRDFPAAHRIIRKYGLSAFISRFHNEPAHSPEELSAMNVIAMSAFYSPVLEEEMGIGLPFSLDTGLPRYEIWQRWLALDPVNTIKVRAGRMRDKQIILQVGKRDEFSLYTGIGAMDRMLQEAGIQHTMFQYDQGHFGIDFMYSDSIPLAIRGILAKDR